MGEGVSQRFVLVTLSRPQAGDSRVEIHRICPGEERHLVYASALTETDYWANDVKPVLADLMVSGFKQVIFDFAGVATFESFWAGSFAGCALSVFGGGGRLVIARPRDHIAPIFQLWTMYRGYLVVSSLEEAYDCLASGGGGCIT